MKIDILVMEVVKEEEMVQVVELAVMVVVVLVEGRWMS